MKSNALIATVVVAIVVVVGPVATQDATSGQELAERTKQCYPSTTDLTQLNKCLAEYWNDVRPLLPQGYPDQGIPQVEPLHVDVIEIGDTGSLVQGKATFLNSSVRGISSYALKGVVVDLTAQTISVQLSIPELNVAGMYDMDGTVMMVPVKGDGDYWLKAEGVEAKAVAHIERVGTGLGITKSDIDYEAHKFSGRLNDLLGGQEVGESINKMINDNAQEIFADVKPAITKVIQTVFSQVMRAAIKDLPPEAFITP